MAVPTDSVKISALPTATLPLSGSETFPLVQSGATVQTPISTLASPIFNVKSYGAIGDGTTNDTVSVQSAINAANAAGGGTVFFPKGNYSCTNLTGYGNIIYAGVGSGASLVTARSGTTDLFTFLAQSNIVVRDLTLDYNNLTPGGFYNVLGFIGCSNQKVQNVNVLNMDLIGIGCNGSNYTWIENCTIKRSSPIATPTNEAILFTTGYGSNSYLWVTDCVIVNSGTLLDCTNIVFRGNYVVGWQYGAGFSHGNTTGNNYAVVDNNYFSCSYSGLDGNGFSCKGIEFFGSNGRISNNICWNNGGSGIYCGGPANIITGNLCYNNGLYTAEVSGGISLGYLTATTNAQYSIVSDNICYDTAGASGTQDYGIAISSSITSNTILMSNNQVYTNAVGPVSASVSQSFVGENYYATTVWDPPNLAASGTTTNAVTVGGAVFGDIVSVSSSSSMLGIIMTGYVSAANQVTIVLHNPTAAAVNLPSATYRIVSSRTMY